MLGVRDGDGRVPIGTSRAGMIEDTSQVDGSSNAGGASVRQRHAIIRRRPDPGNAIDLSSIAPAPLARFPQRAHNFCQMAAAAEPRHTRGWTDPARLNHIARDCMA